MVDINKQKTDLLRKQIENTLARIPKMEDANALKRLHANIKDHPDLDDFDREKLDEAAMLRLRMISPAIATRIGGPKYGDGLDFLNKLYDRVSGMFDLSGNRLGQGVKPGGNMINGNLYVDVYLSYKTSGGKNLSFAWIQEEVGSKPFLELLLRHVGKDGEGEILRERFSDPDKAVEQYLQQMASLIG